MSIFMANMLVLTVLIGAGVVLLYLYIRNPLSIQTKLCILIGYIPESLRKLEWVFIPKNNGQKQRKIIVAFAGGGVRIGGESFGEFAKSLRVIEDCDSLLLSDSLQLWFLSEYNDLHAKLQQFLEGYEVRLFIGNCLGGTGALLYADLATTVLTFGAQTSFVHAKGIYWFNSWRLERSYRVGLEAMIEARASQCPGQCFAYFSPLKDTYMAAFTPKNIRTEVIAACTDALVPQWLKKQEGDSNGLVKFICNHLR